MIFWIFLLLLPLAVVLKVRAQERRITPDAGLYIALSEGSRVPSPYCYRVLLPLLAMSAARWNRQPRKTLAGLGLAGAAGAVVATYALTLTLSGSDHHPRALLSAYAIVFADAYFAYSVRTPWLVDATASALALVSVVLAFHGHPWGAAALLGLASLAKESWAIFGWAFVVAAVPALWWTSLPALGAHAVLRSIAKPVPPDPRSEPWLVDPLGWAWTHKRQSWFEWRTNIGRLGPTPWLLAYYAGSSALAPSAVAVAVLAWAQAHVAADQDRLLAHMLPFAIPVVCSAAPMEILVVYAVASCYWPFYRTA